MAFPEHINSENEPTASNTMQKKPRVLLAASGSVAAIKFESLCHSFSEWAEVKAVTTKSALHFIDKASLPMDVVVHSDEEEWSSWQKIGDSVLHIELRKWADVIVIAPLSANTLGKIAGGLCDNLLTCIVRAWDYKKPVFVAPAMNTYMWSNPFTQKHLDVITELATLLVIIREREMENDSHASKMEKKRVLVTFDIDGTLIHSSGLASNRLHHQAFSHAFLDVFGIEGTTDSIQHHGQTDPGVIVNTLVHYGIPSEVATEKLPILKSRMVEYAIAHAKDVREGLEVLPGVDTLLQVLSSREDVVVGLVTGNLEEIAWLKMEGLGIKKHFTVPNFGGFGSDHIDRGQLVKIAADRAEMLFPGGFDQRVHVGDTPNDIKAAEFGGALAIGVCTGIFSKQELEQASNGGAVILANLCDCGSFMNLLGIQS